MKASIMLNPVTEMISVRTEMSSTRTSMKKVSSKARRAALAEKPDDDQDDNEDEYDEDEDLERVYDPLLAAAMLPLVWSPFGPFMAAGFLPYFAAASMLTPSLEADLEVSKAVAFKRHSRTLEMAVQGQKVSFKSARELERKQFLPLVAAPFLFFPWGFALGAEFFTVAASYPLMVAASMPLLTPWATWSKGDHQELFKDMGTTYVKYLQSIWATRVWWSLNMGGYWGWLMYSIYWQPALVNWSIGFYKFWTEYWAKVYKFWVDYWKAVGEKWSAYVTSGISKFPIGPLPSGPLPSPSPAPMMPEPTPTAVTRLNARTP